MVKLKDFNIALNLYCVGEKDHPTDPIIFFEHGLGGSYGKI